MSATIDYNLTTVVKPLLELVRYLKESTKDEKLMNLICKTEFKNNGQLCVETSGSLVWFTNKDVEVFFETIAFYLAEYNRQARTHARSYNMKKILSKGYVALASVVLALFVILYLFAGAVCAICNNGDTSSLQGDTSPPQYICKLAKGAALCKLFDCSNLDTTQFFFKVLKHVAFGSAVVFVISYFIAIFTMNANAKSKEYKKYSDIWNVNLKHTIVPFKSFLEYAKHIKTELQNEVEVEVETEEDDGSTNNPVKEECAAIKDPDYGDEEIGQLISYLGYSNKGSRAVKESCFGKNPGLKRLPLNQLQTQLKDILLSEGLLGRVHYSLLTYDSVFRKQTIQDSFTYLNNLMLKKSLKVLSYEEMNNIINTKIFKVFETQFIVLPHVSFSLDADYVVKNEILSSSSVCSKSKHKLDTSLTAILSGDKIACAWDANSIRTVSNKCKVLKLEYNKLSHVIVRRDAIVNVSVVARTTKDHPVMDYDSTRPEWKDYITIDNNRLRDDSKPMKRYTNVQNRVNYIDKGLIDYKNSKGSDTIINFYLSNTTWLSLFGNVNDYYFESVQFRAYLIGLLVKTMSPYGDNITWALLIDKLHILLKTVGKLQLQALMEEVQEQVKKQMVSTTKFISESDFKYKLSIMTHEEFLKGFCPSIRNMFLISYQDQIYTTYKELMFSKKTLYNKYTSATNACLYLAFTAVALVMVGMQFFNLKLQYGWGDSFKHMFMSDYMFVYISILAGAIFVFSYLNSAHRKEKAAIDYNKELIEINSRRMSELITIVYGCIYKPETFQQFVPQIGQEIQNKVCNQHNIKNIRINPDVEFIDRVIENINFKNFENISLQSNIDELTYSKIYNSMVDYMSTFSECNNFTFDLFVPLPFPWIDITYQLIAIIVITTLILGSIAGLNIVERFKAIKQINKVQHKLKRFIQVPESDIEWISGTSPSLDNITLVILKSLVLSVLILFSIMYSTRLHRSSKMYEAALYNQSKKCVKQ